MSRVRSVTPSGVFIPTVIVDTREQRPFTFANFTCDQQDGGGPLVVAARAGTLASGDYSLAGFEAEIAIERKSLPDLFHTLGQGRERFVRELERLNAMRWAAVVVEATLHELVTEPPPHSDLDPKTVFRSVIAWQQRFTRVHWCFAGPRRLAEAYTLRALERYWKDRQAQTTPPLIPNGPAALPD